jgi:hypothetical protein
MRTARLLVLQIMLLTIDKTLVVRYNVNQYIVIDKMFETGRKFDYRRCVPAENAIGLRNVDL